MTRKLFRGVLVVMLVGVVALAQRPAPAAADWGWCYDDPIVRIGNNIVSITTGVRGDPANVHMARITVAVPKGVRARLLAELPGAFPEHTSFVETNAPWKPGQPIPVTVTVRFDASEPMPARLIIAHPPRKPLLDIQGTTAAPITARFTLPG